MEKLYNEVCNYIEKNNGIADNLYNGILLEVYNEYSYSYDKKENILCLDNLLDIADNIIGSDNFGEVLTELIKEEL